MPTLTLSFAPHTRTAEAAVRAPRKNLRVFGSDNAKLLFATIVARSGDLEREVSGARFRADAAAFAKRHWEDQPFSGLVSESRPPRCGRSRLVGRFTPYGALRCARAARSDRQRR